MRFTSFPLALALVACGGAEDHPVSAHGEAPGQEAARTDAAPSAPPAPGEPRAGASARAEVSLAQERMVIREAHVRLRASDPRALATRAARIAADSGGFVLDSELRGSDGDPREVELHLRVPQEQLDATLGRLRALGTVLEERVSGQDVTEEFVDVSARLSAERTLERRLLALLERSAELKDVLAVEQELARVRANIESREGRVRYLQERTRMASIELVATAPEQPLVAASQSIGSRLSNAWSRAGEMVVSVTESLIVLLGFLLPIGVFAASLALPLAWIRRRYAARRARAA